MDRGDWQATVHGVTKSWTRLKQLSTHAHEIVKNLPATRETQVQTLGWKDPLEKEMATHSKILAWRIPWTEEPGGLQSISHKESDKTEST